MRKISVCATKQAYIQKRFGRSEMNFLASELKKDSGSTSKITEDGYKRR